MAQCVFMPIRLERFANRHYAAACALWEGTHGVDLGGADSEESIAQFHACNPGTTYVALDEAKLVATILVGHVCSSSKSASGSAKALYLMRLARVFLPYPLRDSAIDCVVNMESMKLVIQSADVRARSSARRATAIQA